MKSFQSLVTEYMQCPHSDERFGQWFVNRYTDGNWPELFHEPNDVIALGVVYKWLEDHQYNDTLPQRIGVL